MIINCVVAGRGADGSPDFYFCSVKCTQKQYNDGNHYDTAKEKALDHGYDPPFVVFDENDGPAWLFAQVPWTPEKALERAFFDYLKENLSVEVRDKSEGSSCGGEVDGHYAVEVALLLKDADGVRQVIDTDTTQIG